MACGDATDRTCRGGRTMPGTLGEDGLQNATKCVSISHPWLWRRDTSGHDDAGRAGTHLPPKSVRVPARNAVRADGPSRVHDLPSVRSASLLEPSARHDGSHEPSAFTVLATKDHQAVTTRKRRRPPQETPPTPLQRLGATIRQYRRQRGLTQGPGGSYRAQLDLHQ